MQGFLRTWQEPQFVFKITQCYFFLHLDNLIQVTESLKKFRDHQILCEAISPQTFSYLVHFIAI